MPSQATAWGGGGLSHSAQLRRMPAAGGGVTLAGAIHAIELGTVPPVFRVGWPGLEPGREEVIAAGAIIIRTIMETLGGNECLVSDLGLREGVLIDLAMQTGNR